MRERKEKNFCDQPSWSFSNIFLDNKNPVYALNPYLNENRTWKSYPRVDWQTKIGALIFLYKKLKCKKGTGFLLMFKKFTPLRFWLKIFLKLQGRDRQKKREKGEKKET